MSMMSFDESWMGVNLKDRTPGTSRKGRNRRTDIVGPKPTKKGLPRCMVNVARVRTGNHPKWEVRLKDGGKVLGVIEAHRQSGVTYGYRLLGDVKPHGGFPSLKACVERMLQKL